MNAIAASGRPDPLDDTEAPPCLFCGEPEQVEIFEVWGHEFMLQTCCEPLHEQLIHEFDEDPHWARAYLRRLQLETLCGRSLRRVADDGACGLILDWQGRGVDSRSACAGPRVARRRAVAVEHERLDRQVALEPPPASVPAGQRTSLADRRAAAQPDPRPPKQ